ncbi:hypothetical protein G7Y79_00020g048480 [Physcia stellaris]|nr:hypothetical protein G7Y79_00020g048480 [Physcia stellaris]
MATYIVHGSRKPGGMRKRIFQAYRKNYCPRRAPKLVFPTAPTDKEKYSYLDMKRNYLVICGTVAVLSLAVGGWMMAKADPLYAWYAVYIFVTQFYLFTSLFIPIIGKPFDFQGHQKLLEDIRLTEDKAPKVDVFLPVCNEPLELLENTWRHVVKVQYPLSKKSVHVLDDGANEDVRLSAKRFGFNYICRSNRPELKKAGNLRYAFSQTSAELFAVFDADFCPRPDFLLETVPYMVVNAQIALLQTPQYFRSSQDQKWIEQGAGPLLEYYYRVMQTCRDKWGAALCVGSNAIYRRTALHPIRGTYPIASSEDNYTGIYVATHGWIIKAIPLVLACGTSPDNPRALFTQQLRWCSGSMSLCFSRSFWTNALSVKQKLCHLVGFIDFILKGTQPILSQIPAHLILWTRPDLFKYYYIFFGFPTLFLELVVFRIWTRIRYTLSVQYSVAIMSYACLQAIWDQFFGNEISWTPSGGKGKTHRNHRYRNMRILASIWTITHNSALITACIYRVAVWGLHWYHVVPALIMNGYQFLCVHRFLFYRHAKDC